MQGASPHLPISAGGARHLPQSRPGQPLLAGGNMVEPLTSTHALAAPVGAPPVARRCGSGVAGAAGRRAVGAGVAGPGPGACVPCERGAVPGAPPGRTWVLRVRGMSVLCGCAWQQLALQQQQQSREDGGGGLVCLPEGLTPHSHPAPLGGLICKARPPHTNSHTCTNTRMSVHTNYMHMGTHTQPRSPPPPPQPWRPARPAVGYRLPHV